MVDDRNERRRTSKSKTKDLEIVKISVFNDKKENKDGETIKKTRSTYNNNVLHNSDFDNFYCDNDSDNNDDNGDNNGNNDNNNNNDNDDNNFVFYFSYIFYKTITKT